MQLIDENTKLKDLIEMGLVQPGMIGVWNDRLERNSKKESKQNDKLEVLSFIKENAKEGIAYKTGNFLDDVLKEKPHIGQDLGEGRIKYVHTLITLSLKTLVDDGTFVVFNNTNNHAHNRYGFKPNLNEVPEFSTNQ